MKRWHDTLVILGSHPDTRKEWDWDRVGNVDVWAFNEAVSRDDWIRFASAVFQMHIPAIWRNPANRNDNKHAEWLVGGDTPPVIMQEAYPDVPQAEAYPIDDVIAKLLPGFHTTKSGVWNNRGGFFTSSLDFALAMAVYLEYKRVEIYGCEMAMNTEYVYQRPGFTFWVGMALGRGIEIDYHGSIFNVPLYGYEGDIYLPRKLFDDRVIEMQHFCQEATFVYQKSKDETQAALKDFVEHKTDHKPAFQAVQRQLAAAQQFGHMDGILQENEHYVKSIDAMEGQAGDYRISMSEFEFRQRVCKKNIDKLVQDANHQALQLQRAFEAIGKAEGYKKRTIAAGDFMTAFNEQVRITTELAGYNGAVIENERYMHILQEKYRAAGGAKSVEVLEKMT